MASSSSYPSYNISPKWTYDVFLSFRGEDTRRNFVDHLYTALGDRGIYTFKDDKNLKQGQSISPKLIKAIEESRFAVVIFSRNYADSSWCLDELAKIVECKHSMDQILVPVFYDVDPSEVRKQTGCYEKAFAKHEIIGKEEDRIQTWRNALAEAASTSGWFLPHIANGYESVCIRQIVGHILTILGCGTTLSFAENLIGVESRMLKVKSLLIGSNEVQILGIWGMGGLGKTTVARAVFDDISNQFEGRSFVANVREVSKSSGLHSLQEKILSEILMERDLKVRSVDEGIIVMKRLCHKKVLLVLDDVDQLNQLEALAGKLDWFGKGSIIIITTRDKHLLVAHGVKQIHKVVLLNDDEALLLFSRYAFQSKSPPEEYVEPSRLVVRNAGGLPLALKVSGSFLCGRGLDVWKSTRDILKHVPDNEIVDILKISFDGLKHFEKEMFLDIACFFIGMKKDDESKILDSSDFFPDIVISVLEEKSLITVSKGTIQMHDLIRHVGWHIVQQTDPGRRTRVWLPKDADAVFTDDDKGTEAIETLTLDYRTKMRFTSESFRNMKKLRLLHVSSDSEKGLQGPEYLPNELCWICWHTFPSKSLPASYQGEKLICLDMPFSNIRQLWKAKKILDKLKFIDLSNSDKLISTPDFSGVPNLSRLILRGCTSLKKVHPSLGDLKRLIVLDFSTCERLTNFSSDFNMTSLEILILSGCSELKVFPKIIGKMERLRELYLDGTMIQRLHPSIGKLTGLVLTNLSNCKNLRHLPRTIASLKRMKTLDLCGCINLKQLPENLGQMARLEELLLTGTAVTRPPSSIVQLQNLQTLSFGISNLTLSLFKWRSLKSMDLVRQCLTDSSFIKKLNLSYCNLCEIPGVLSQLYFLEELSLSGNEFTCLPDSLCQLSKLKVLELKDCTRLVALKELPTSIAMLIMDDCKSLESLGDLFTTKYKWLHEVSFSNCFKLTKNEQRSSSSRSSVVADMLLWTMLQGRSVKNHKFSILVPGSEIPDWFTHQGKGKKFPGLQLLPDWHERIVGFAMCCVFRTTIPFKIRIFLGLNHKTLIFNESWCQMLSSDHLWMGYISFDFFREQFFDKYKKVEDWLGGTEESFLRIHPTCTCDSIKKSRINEVYRDNVTMIEEEEDSSQSAGNFGFFPTKKWVGHFYFE